ncbi:hypothetical protein AB0K20_31225 [Micromonospora matsumotoense]|uniref:hypothetical protein n=1 Tax=Micromonospora matsumotoense TaxID=121616 RepID=UPI00342AAFF6
MEQHLTRVYRKLRVRRRAGPPRCGRLRTKPDFHARLDRVAAQPPSKDPARERSTSSGRSSAVPTRRYVAGPAPRVYPLSRAKSRH